MPEWTKLKKLRKQAGYTQEYLANLVNISTMQLHRLESGETDKHSTKASTLRALANALGTTMEYLLLKRSDDVDLFFEVLENLSDREIAQLRKGAGQYMADMQSKPDNRSFAPFMKAIALSGIKIDDEELEPWYNVACFYAYQRFNKNEGTAQQLPEIMGTMTGKLNIKDDARFTSTYGKRTTNALENPYWEEGGALYSINSLFRLAVQNEYTVDCKALLRDLKEWGSEDVKHRWAALFVEALEQEE